jgi:ABC-2 type transport system permease protein
MIGYSLANNRKNHKEILIRSLFFVAILYIFSKLWAATQFSNPENSQLMVWYLALTELIILSIPLVQVDIENDIRSGDIVYQLLKPVSYLWLKISDSVGAFLFRFLILGAIAFPLCIALSGTVPSLALLIASFFSALLAGFVFIFFHTAIGLTAFIFQDSSPIFWLWQRCSFLLGGMLLPLDYYPSYLQWIASVLPFSSLLYKPAKLLLECSVEQFLFTILAIIFWGAFALFLTYQLYGRLLRSLRINGG